MEENNGEISSGKYFHLIGDLERGDRAVADSNELKRILDDVKDGGMESFQQSGLKISPQRPETKGNMYRGRKFSGDVLMRKDDNDKYEGGGEDGLVIRWENGQVRL